MEENKKVFEKPSFEEFSAFAKRMRWDNWYIEVWNELEKTQWLKKDGTYPMDWKTMANVRNGIVMMRLKIQNPKKQPKTAPSELNTIAYTYGCCHDNYGGSAYILVNGGSVTKISSHGQKNTTKLRMNLLAAISAVNACPVNSYVEVFTDSPQCFQVLSSKKVPNKNRDLYEKYKVYSSHVAGVRFHLVTEEMNDSKSTMVKELAQVALGKIRL